MRSKAVWGIFCLLVGFLGSFSAALAQTVELGPQIANGSGDSEGWRVHTLRSVNDVPTFGNHYGNIEYRDGCGFRGSELTEVNTILLLPADQIREENDALHRFLSLLVPVALRNCEDMGGRRIHDTEVRVRLLAPELIDLGITYPVARADFVLYRDMQGRERPTVERAAARFHIGSLLREADFDLTLVARAVERNPQQPVTAMRRMEQEQLFSFCDAPPLSEPIVVEGQNIRLLSPPEICELYRNLVGFSSAYLECSYDRNCDREHPETLRFMRTYVGPAYTVLAHNLRHYIKNTPEGLVEGQDYRNSIQRLVWPAAGGIPSEYRAYFDYQRDYTGHPMEAFNTHRGYVAHFLLLVGDAYVRTRLDDRNDGYLDDISPERYQELMLTPPGGMMTAVRYNQIAANFEESRRRRAAQRERDAPIELLAGFILFGMAVHLASPYDADAAQEAWTPDTPIHTFGYSANDLMVGNPFPSW